MWLWGQRISIVSIAHQFTIVIRMSYMSCSRHSIQMTATIVIAGAHMIISIIYNIIIIQIVLCSHFTFAGMQSLSFTFNSFPLLALMSYRSTIRMIRCTCIWEMEFIRTSCQIPFRIQRKFPTNQIIQQNKNQIEIQWKISGTFSNHRKQLLLTKWLMAVKKIANIHVWLEYHIITSITRLHAIWLVHASWESFCHTKKITLLNLYIVAVSGAKSLIRALDWTNQSPSVFSYLHTLIQVFATLILFVNYNYKRDFVSWYWLKKNDNKLILPQHRQYRIRLR